MKWIDIGLAVLMTLTGLALGASAITGDYPSPFAITSTLSGLCFIVAGLILKR